MALILLTLVFLAFFIVYDWWKRREFVEGIQKKAVFITGCDSGFGNALAKSLYDKGVPVYAACLTEEGAKNLKAEIGDGLKTLIIDVTNTGSIRKAAAVIENSIPNNTVLWGVVNNAGIAGHWGPVEILTKDDFRQVMDVNLYGMIGVSVALLPMLKKSKGRVVNMSSMAGDVAFPNRTPYCASKHAATGFSESLRVEKSLWDISVSTIEPGFYLSNTRNVELYREKAREKWMSANQRTREEYGEDYAERSIALTGAMLNDMSSSAIKPVIEAMEHALFSVCPRDVYYPGVKSKLLKIMPYFIRDKLFLHYIELPKCLRKK